MKLLIDLNTLNKYKSRDKLPLQCKGCNKIFFRPKNHIQAIILGNCKSTYDFCSNKSKWTKQTTKQLCYV